MRGIEPLTTNRRDASAILIAAIGLWINIVVCFDNLGGTSNYLVRCDLLLARICPAFRIATALFIVCSFFAMRLPYAHGQESPYPHSHEGSTIDRSAIVGFAVLVAVAMIVAAVTTLAYSTRSGPVHTPGTLNRLRGWTTRIGNILADNTELSGVAVRLLSLFFLLVAGLMSFQEYSRPGYFWPYAFSFSPTFLSTGLGLLLVAPLYLRRILKWNLSIYSILSLVLILMVFASFVQFVLGGNLKGEIIAGMIGAAVLLSWLGIRSVAGVGWLLPFGAAVYTAMENSSTMGFYGYIYLTSGLLGLLLHTGLNPGQLIQGFREEFSPAAEKMLAQPMQDVAGLGEAVKDLSSEAAKLAPLASTFMGGP